MNEVKIWHNPRCRKSREGLQFLENKNISPLIIDYMKEGIDAQKLTEIIKMSNQPLKDFIRTNEKEYKELGLKGKNLSVEEFAKIAAAHPKLLQRPIVIKGNRAVMGRPASRIEEIL